MTPALAALVVVGCCYQTAHAKFTLMVREEYRPDGTYVCDVSDAVPTLGGEAGAYGLGSPAAMAAIGIPGAVKSGFDWARSTTDNLTTSTKEIR